MTDRTTMALMAAALILVVQGHARAQSPNCPCGDPADLVPLAKWPTKALWWIVSSSVQVA